MDEKKEINPAGIYNSRLIDASPEKIFTAFADPGHLKNWWGPKGFSNTFNEFNFEIDGKWDFIMHGPDGKEYKNTSIFSEIINPFKIVIEHISPPHFILTITLIAENNKTRIYWGQVFDSVEIKNSIEKIVDNANEENLDRLENELKKF